MNEGSRKAIVAAFLANLGIAIAKLIGFVITGSAGLLAESMHSLADTGNQALLMFGARRGKRRADAAHPFGYGPERYFWAFVVALVLFSLGGLFALYEGIDKLIHPHEVESAVGRRSSSSASRWRWSRGRCAPRCTSRDRRSDRARAGGGSSTPRSPRSCPSCCWRTPAH